MNDHKARRSLERRFQRTLLDNRLLESGSLIIAALSGGADSSALLLLLHDYALKAGCRVEAAYFDHQIREAGERRAERETVHRLADTLGVPLHEGGADIPGLARQRGHSIEEQARLERYAFLRELANTRGASAVATGHTATDQVETVLLHIIRGSGLLGLTGMAVDQPWVFGDGPRLIRPLLSFSRAETEHYCELRGVTFHRDSLNDAPGFTRNRVRHELLPLLRGLNPAVDRAILRLSVSAAQQRSVTKLLLSNPQLIGGEQAGIGWYHLQHLRMAPVGYRNELFFRGFAVAAGDRRGLGERHLVALSNLVRMGGEHSLDLPAGVRARVDGSFLYFGPTGSAGEEPAAFGPLPEAELDVPGQLRIGPWEIAARILAPGELPADFDGYVKAFDMQRLSLPLRVRSRRPGDRIRPAGMLGSKKIQDILVDGHVPRSERDLVPIICSDDKIIWVAGYRPSADFVARPGTARIVEIAVRRQSPDPVPPV